MPLCVVLPLEFKKSAATRDLDEATVFFPYDNDFGIKLSDVPIFLVFNGIDHYIGVREINRTFKDGTKELYKLLSSARALSDSLAQSTENEIVKRLFQKASENSVASLYSVDNLMQQSHTQAPVSSKRRRISGDSPEEKQEKKRLTKEGKTAWTEFTCYCGVPKNSKEDLDDHKKRRHENNYWKCILEDCPKRVKTKSGTALKKHVQNQHFGEYYYFCLYCNYGSDEQHLVENHQGDKHKAGVSIPCSKVGCQKSFYSEVSLERHQKFCRIKKDIVCNICNKSFKRKDNYNHHMAVHSGQFEKIKCEVCLKNYQSKTSYDAHIRNKQCYPTDQEEQDEIEQIENEELETLSEQVNQDEDEESQDSEGSQTEEDEDE